MNTFWVLWFLIGFCVSAGIIAQVWMEEEYETITVEDVGTTLFVLLIGTSFGFVTVFFTACVFWDDWGIGEIVLWRRNKE